jgi:hypothetical protein
MLKSYILNYQTSIKNSIKSSSSTVWIVSLTVVPVAIYALLLLFETPIAELIMNVYPPSFGKGEAYYRDYIYIARVEVLWVGLFFLISLLLALYTSGNVLDRHLKVASDAKVTYYVMLVACGYFLITLLITNYVLEGFPNSSDEYAYILQAEMLAATSFGKEPTICPIFSITTISRNTMALL